MGARQNAGRTPPNGVRRERSCPVCRQTSANAPPRSAPVLQSLRTNGTAGGTAKGAAPRRTVCPKLTSQPDAAHSRSAAPLVPIPGERVRAAVFDLALHHPAAVRLKVRLVDDVQAVTVTELVKTALVRIVRGTHGVEIVLLQKLQVAFDFIARDGAAPIAGKLVPVDAAQDETLAV